MCGIVGYLGPRETVGVLMDGLRRLEYRGYDSAGIAVFHGGKIEVRRARGKLRVLEEAIAGESLEGKVGIGHTRWATHGRPSDDNAHPHKAGSIAVVHNGIIENYLSLKKVLTESGHVFASETDTEVIAHLVDHFLREDFPFEEAVRRALGKIKGSYALAVLCEKEPEKLIGARNESPLVVGLGEGELLIASDTPAVLNYTRDFIFLEDGEMAVLSDGKAEVLDLEGKRIPREPKRVKWNPLMAEKGGYKHFMLKEIMEQPRAITDTIRGRISEDRSEIIFEGLDSDGKMVKAINRIALVACGTSYHAALVGRYLIESLCRIPVEADIGSEFRYRNPLVDEKTLLVTISQSGETADTLAALREARKRGARTLGICNVVESSLSRESDYTIFTYAGPEIGVASTKAFSTQLVILYLLSLFLGKRTGYISHTQMDEFIGELVRLPHLLEEVVRGHKEIERIGRKYVHAENFLYLGRGINYPIALEGALKLKEISYIHAEGYPAGEMKHGPIALIDREMPVVVLATKDDTYEKVMNNIEEVHAREGRIIALASQGDKEIASKVEDVIFIPPTVSLLTPVLLTIPLQLLAYYMADFKGNDVDQPRNLAKSVTVE
ncbi:MAG: glutamine--fructose-6-phosphate transaminase (isomerizing) [Syntrophobacterales bacterium]|nr:MAG: glutamine--fructose-6-phosphate transaminase (isomerizing) [Syntrophobacterales bacterium]